MHLNARSLGLTAGIFAGAGWFLVMVFSLATRYADDLLMKIGGYHPGFSYNLGGAVWMGILHFIALYIVGYLFATVYNKLTK